MESMKALLFTFCLALLGGFSYICGKNDSAPFHHFVRLEFRISLWNDEPSPENGKFFVEDLQHDIISHTASASSDAHYTSVPGKSMDPSSIEWKAYVVGLISAVVAVILLPSGLAGVATWDRPDVCMRKFNAPILFIAVHQGESLPTDSPVPSSGGATIPEDRDDASGSGLSDSSNWSDLDLHDMGLSQMFSPKSVPSEIGSTGTA